MSSPDGRAWRRTEGRRPFVLGHRGARHAAPENTLAAFELARQEGADGVELDVRLDAAGRVIVLHDRTLARVTGWHDVRDVELVGPRELSRVDVGRGERVPLLADVLAWASSAGLRVNVELKRDVSDRRALVFGVARVIEDFGDAGELALCSSFHPGIVRALATRLPRVASAWLVHAGQRVLRRAPGFALLGAVGVHPERVLASAGEVTRWKRAGAIVNVWTVNDADEARRLASFGVDGIISDRPGTILAAL